MALYFTVLRKYAVFAGRARPKEYWMYVLISVVVVLGGKTPRGPRRLNGQMAADGGL